MISEQSYALLGMFKHYQKGLMPITGGFLEQPAKFMRAMAIIEGQFNRE